MQNTAIGALKLSEFLKPKDEGETVNVHVVAPAKEPEPDFDAIKKLISGEAKLVDREGNAKK